MASTLRFKRGTTLANSTYTGPYGEITIDGTNNAVVVHNGSTAGGFPAMRADGSNSTVTLGLVQVDYYFTAGTYTYTRPTGVNYLLIELQGGGGAGGGGNASYSAGWAPAAGGGAGGYARIWYPLPSNFTTQQIKVGAGGLASTTGNGGAGDSSYFGSTLYLVNGGGGGAAVAPTTKTIGGTGGGIVHFGGFASQGQEGTGGFMAGTSGTATIYGRGGQSFLGRGGVGNTSPQSGLLGGGGSGGGGYSLAGGNGGAGAVIIWGYR